MKKLLKLLCKLRIYHYGVRGSRFHDWHCWFCGRFVEESVTYDNGHVDPHYTGLLYKADNPKVLYRKADRPLNHERD